MSVDPILYLYLLSTQNSLLIRFLARKISGELSPEEEAALDMLLKENANLSHRVFDELFQLAEKEFQSLEEVSEHPRSLIYRQLKLAIQQLKKLQELI